MLAFRYRFHGHGSLRYVYKNGETVRGRLMTIKYTKNPRRKHSRFSVVVSKKVLKSAVGRNRIRRRIYEALRDVGALDLLAYDVAVIVTSAEVRTIEYGEIQAILGDFVAARQQK